MMRHRAHISVVALAFLAGAKGAAWGAQDVRKIKLAQPELKVIEEKCLVCHNHQRIDAAREAQRDTEATLRRMEAKGVRLTTRDRQVIGHFLSNPFKGGDREAGTTGGGRAK